MLSQTLVRLPPGLVGLPGSPRVDIYTLGDDLLHVGGPSQFTGFCGIHTGWIEARVRVLCRPPSEVDVCGEGAKRSRHAVKRWLPPQHPSA
ncbi:MULTISPECIES: hypothetical protein [unclassified Micromonospora]|uniref:hypothetical protein n=1 Tax=unclassified Micromonospora TaxID=2617518 RepID=UPI002FF24387